MTRAAPIRRYTCSHCGLPVARREAGGGRPVYCCYGCYLVSRLVGPRSGRGDQAWNLLRLGIGAFLAMNVMMISVLLYTGSAEEQAASAFRWVLLGLSAPAVAILGYPFAVGAAREIARRRLSLDTLIAVGSLGAFTASAIHTVRGAGHVYYDTATMLPLLVTFGKIVEASAKGRTSDLVREMESLLPEQAERLGEVGGPRAVSVGELRKGDRVLVRPGGRFPADGVVVEGASTVLEAAFTGEAGARPCGRGDRVLAGTVNQEGALVVEAREVGAGLLLSRIIEMVHEARQRVAPYERSAERAAAFFTPATLVLAAAAGGAWLLARGGAEAGLAALAVVVVACPCALGIATPLAVALAIGRAAREGVLIRGGEVLERAGRIDTVFFDKTGTLTAGEPTLTHVECLDPSLGEEDLLGWLAGLESQSEHALARSAVEAARQRGAAIGTVREFRAFPGQGACGLVSLGGTSRLVRAGSEEFVRKDIAGGTSRGDESLATDKGGTDKGGTPSPLRTQLRGESRLGCHGCAFPQPCGMRMLQGTSRWDVAPVTEALPSPRTGTVVAVAWEGQVRGRVTFADVVRPEAAESIRSLAGMGIRSVLLSGDRLEAARSVARQVGIDQVEAPCLPDDKLRHLCGAAQAGHFAAMVGDGVNDAPALAAAEVGIAIGAGTDLARQSGGVVLLSSRLVQIPWLIALARRTRRVVSQNLAWAFAYNAVALAAAAAGVLHPLLAAVAMVVSSLTVLSNSLRLRAFPPPAAREIPAQGGARQ